MSDSLREALEFARICIWNGGDSLEALRIIDAALSAPQADAEAVAWRIRVVDGSYCKVIPEGELEIWKQNWSRHLQSGHAVLEPLGVIGTAPSSQSAQMREALVLAEDVLSRAPFSTGIWPNGMHPQRGIEIIRKALSRADKESEGGEKAGAPVVLPEVEDTVSSLSQSVGALHPSDPTPVQDAEPVTGAQAAGRTGGANPPTGSTPPDEAIARIIDPKAHSAYDDCHRNADETGKMFWITRLKQSREKADAILALLRGGQ